MCGLTSLLDVGTVSQTWETVLFVILERGQQTGIRPPTEVTDSLLRLCIINTRRTNLNSLADDTSLVLDDDGDLKTCLVERFT